MFFIIHHLPEFIVFVDNKFLIPKNV